MSRLVWLIPLFPLVGALVNAFLGRLTGRFAHWIAVPALGLLFRFVVAERMGTIILSALVAHTGWHWMLERGARLRQFHVQRPAIDAAFLASATRWLMVAVIGAALLWVVAKLPKRRQM